ncbi:DUF2092 domain-containing protein [Corallococcus carmarthensis]|nr:DUF2092 domain-containing protein [Corallococcus carmarthensis]NOK22037.1 DUF2092 domain-containing protein [Corallococcus carmarthensis]
MGMHASGRSRRVAWAVVSGALVGWTVPALGAEEQASSTAPEIDPQALSALNRMGAFLRDQQSFAVRAETTTDEVLTSGQKVQFSGQSDIQVRRPDRLRADISSDRKQRQLFYDGKTFTVNGPRMGYYASFDAPPTLAKTIQEAEQRFGIEVPLVDLFYWGTDQSGVRDIQSAIDVGPARVQGVDTEHYAFRQDGVDWQLWIEKGDTPLPRKLVITTVKEPAQPQHAVLLDWNLRPRLDDAAFAFVPAKDSHRIVLEEAKARSRQPD